MAELQQDIVLPVVHLFPLLLFTLKPGSTFQTARTVTCLPSAF